MGIEQRGGGHWDRRENIQRRRERGKTRKAGRKYEERGESKNAKGRDRERGKVIVYVIVRRSGGSGGRDSGGESRSRSGQGTGPGRYMVGKKKQPWTFLLQLRLSAHPTPCW
eukprot:766613-Hanusia_phi.AAC.1